MQKASRRLTSFCRSFDFDNLNYLHVLIYYDIFMEVRIQHYNFGPINVINHYFHESILLMSYYQIHYSFVSIYKVWAQLITQAIFFLEPKKHSLIIFYFDYKHIFIGIFTKCFE